MGLDVTTELNYQLRKYFMNNGQLPIPIGILYSRIEMVHLMHLVRMVEIYQGAEYAELCSLSEYI